jgi:hypothetical protein
MLSRNGKRTRPASHERYTMSIARTRTMTYSPNPMDSAAASIGRPDEEAAIAYDQYFYASIPYVVLLIRTKHK